MSLETLADAAVLLTAALLITTYFGGFCDED